MYFGSKKRVGRNNRIEKVTLLSAQWIGRVIGVPGHLGKSRRYKNDMVFILQTEPLDDIETGTIAMFIERLYWQYIDHREPRASPNSVRGENVNE